MVKIVNIRTYEFSLGEVPYPIHRPYPLGNPFPLINVNNIVEREECIKKYAEWFLLLIEKNDMFIVNQISFLNNLLKLNKTIVLCCFCYPKKCHGNVIKEYLEKGLKI
jgi:hypothetical protein